MRGKGIGEHKGWGRGIGMGVERDCMEKKDGWGKVRYHETLGMRVKGKMR